MSETQKHSNLNLSLLGLALLMKNDPSANCFFELSIISKRKVEFCEVLWKLCHRLVHIGSASF